MVRLSAEVLNWQAVEVTFRLPAATTVRLSAMLMVRLLTGALSRV